MGGIAGEGESSSSSPVVGLSYPQVCAQRLPPRQSHEHPFAFFVLAFVLVWLVAWVGFVVAPPPVLVTGSALGDALGVFLVPMLALLRFEIASGCQFWTV